MSNNNVQLTRINVYNERQCQIYSISRDLQRSLRPNDRIIKRNIFGHRWVFRVNDYPKKEKRSWKLYVYILVTICILTAVFSGVYFTFESKFKSTSDNSGDNKYKNVTKQDTESNKTITSHSETITSDGDIIKNTIELNNDITQVENTVEKIIEDVPLINETLTSNVTDVKLCNCMSQEVCLKLNETSKPHCIKMKDEKDPTGCGGHCIINVERCKSLDTNREIHQCVRMQHVLDCPKNMFNCGNMCISQSKRCDGVINCVGKVDEIDCVCNSSTHFQCGNETSCLPLSKKCNGIVDCWDKSDETNCALHDCDNNNELPCTNGQCIRRDAFCDGTIHCTDKSDEPTGCQ